MPAITIYYKKKQIKTNVEKGTILQQELTKHGIYINSPCGGNGTCGKCMVSVICKNTTEKVLSCTYKIEQDCAIHIPSEALLSKSIPDATLDISFQIPTNDNLGVAFDLGSTTISGRLISLDSGEVLFQLSEWNRLITYGSDVISRVKYIMDHEDGLEEESSLIQTQISDMIHTLCSHSNCSLSAVRKVVIAGNTIMQHIFAKISPVSIATAPYNPTTLFDHEHSFHYDQFPNMDFFFLPCLSGFIGGDITGGLIKSIKEKNDGSYLYIDIGTNGEMVLFHNDHYYTCSVATGPAFEGAMLSCGMTGKEGAITHVSYDKRNHNLNFTVYGNHSMTGICGSGYIDLLAVLLKSGIIDHQGRLQTYKEIQKQLPRASFMGLMRQLGYGFIKENACILHRNPSVFLTQEDIRKLQLAKASVSAGIELLLQNAGVTFDDIKICYLAGSFGEHLNIENAIRTGMLPKELNEKIISIGNGSLEGASKTLLGNHVFMEYMNIINHSTYIELANQETFHKLYVDHINFPVYEQI